MRVYRPSPPEAALTSGHADRLVRALLARKGAHPMFYADTFNVDSLTVMIAYDTDAPDPRAEFDNYSDDEVQAWQDGDVFGFIITGPDGEHEDSCWGFYGFDWCKESALDAAQFLVASEDPHEPQYA